MILKVGTRGSRLSRMQTEKLLEDLKLVNREVDFKLSVIKTLGDTERSKPLFTIDRRGIFEREIDQALLNGEVDFAVASLKDVPTGESTGIVVTAIPKRASPFDVLISKDKIHFKYLKKKAVIGTGSLRRLAQIKHIRPDLDVQPIRGNVDTRIKKVREGKVEGIIIAEAGLERMKLTDQITERFPLELFPSAPGQGALAVVTRKHDFETIKVLKVMDNKQTRAEVTAERTLMLLLGGGCRVPIGAVGKAYGQFLTLRGVLFTVDGQSKIEASAKGSIDTPEDLGKRVAELLVEQGAKRIMSKWRRKYGPW